MSITHHPSFGKKENLAKRLNTAHTPGPDKNVAAWDGLGVFGGPLNSKNIDFNFDF